MKKENLHIVVIGEVDHGKSTLMGRLLFDTGTLAKDRMREISMVSQKLGKRIEFAFLLDQLREEREGLLTIDTTQSFFKTKKRSYTIIDVPGHIEFLKNMMTGATYADIAVLVVDAREGLKEQTKRHLNILDLLGKREIIAVINKMDLIGYEESRFLEIKNQLLDFSKILNINPLQIIPICAEEGENILRKAKRMHWYKGLSLIEALDSFKSELNQQQKPFRFPIQDIYEKKILVGRVESGRVKEADRIEILPCHKKAEVVSIVVWPGKKREAIEGESIGMLVSADAPLKRGDILTCENSSPQEKNEFLAKIFCIEDSLYLNSLLQIRCATQIRECFLSKIFKRVDSSTLEVISEDTNLIKRNEIGVVKITAKTPIIVEDFNFIPALGRFILVSGDEIKAIGIIEAQG